MSQTPKLINIHRAKQLALTNYLKPGFEKFAQETLEEAAAGTGLPTTFNTPEDLLEYLISTAKPIKAIFMSIDPTEGQQGGIAGTYAYLLSFKEIDEFKMEVELAFFTNFPGIYLCWPPTIYEILPLEQTDEPEDGELVRRQYCPLGEGTEIIAMLQEAKVIKTAEIIPIKP